MPKSQTFKLNRRTVEKMMAEAGLRPEKKETIGAYEVYIADGYSPQPHITFRRFGVEKGEFWWGCYATFWFIARDEDFFEIGAPMIFEAFHDPQYDTRSKKQARINTALREASGFIKRRKEIAEDGVSV